MAHNTYWYSERYHRVKIVTISYDTPRSMYKWLQGRDFTQCDLNTYLVKLNEYGAYHRQPKPKWTEEKYYVIRPKQIPMNKRLPLTLGFIKRYISEHRSSPTRREIAMGLGFPLGTVQSDIVELEKRGMIKLVRGFRNIRLADLED